MVRKTVLALVVLSLASMAFAVTVPMQGYEGHVKMKFTDFTHLYDPVSGRPIDIDGDPFYQNPVNWVGLEVRSIFNCYSLGYVDDNDVFHETWSPMDSNEQLTGVFHNTVITGAQSLGGIMVITTDAPLAPPPPPFDTDIGGATNPPVAMPPAGGRVTLYVDDMNAGGTDYTNNPSNDGDGTDEWGGLDAMNRRWYPTVTDGEVFFDSIMVDLSAYRVGLAPGTVKLVALNLITRTGTSEFMLNSIDPLAEVHTIDTDGVVRPGWAGQQSEWTDDPNALLGDAHGLTNLEWRPFGAGGYRGWFFKSEDPVDFAAVPEPGTCLLLGGAVIALVRRRRNR